MIGVGLPLRRKRTFNLIDSELSVEESGDTMDTDLEILDVFLSDNTKEEVGEMRDWCEEFQPSSSSELVGNKKQINELHTFLKYYLSHSAPTFKRFLIQNNYPNLSSDSSAIETPDPRKYTSVYNQIMYILKITEENYIMVEMDLILRR